MNVHLASLRDLLHSGIRLSMQSSYARRYPQGNALAPLTDARNGLREFVTQESENVEGWNLLSLAEECLLNYDGALRAHERAMSLAGTRDKKSLKRWAMLKKSLTEWTRMPLSPGQLHELGCYLRTNGADSENNGRTLRFTRQWLESHAPMDSKKVLDALAQRGAYTDFQVYFNVVRG